MMAWTDTDTYTLKACADQGIIALCYALRRPPDDIRSKAEELRVAIVNPPSSTVSLPEKVPADYYELIELYGSTQAEYCPMCGAGIVVPWHQAGKLGICPACYRKAEREALEVANSEAIIKREKDKIKKRTQRVREQTGDNPRKSRTMEA